MSDTDYFGDTSLHTWMMELLTACVREVDGRDQFDVNMMFQMVRSEPKWAGDAIQLWAQDLDQELGGRPVTEAEGSTATKVLVVGALIFCYDLVAKKAGEERTPQGWSRRAEWLMSLHPIIYDCLNYTSGFFKFPGQTAS